MARCCVRVVGLEFSVEVAVSVGPAREGKQEGNHHSSGFRVPCQPLDHILA